MKRTLLLIVCVVCLVLCACTPQESVKPETTPAATEPKPSPGMTIIAPSDTPGEYIDPVDPSEGPVIIPIETPAPTPDGTPVGTPAPTPDGTPAGTPAPTPDSTPAGTPAPTPEETPESTEGGITLPFIPVGPK